LRNLSDTTEGVRCVIEALAMASKCCTGLFFIPCMPVAQLVSSTSGPALPDEASLLCGDRGTWQRESPTEALATDRRDDEDDPGGFLSLPNLTLR